MANLSPLGAPMNPSRIFIGVKRYILMGIDFEGALKRRASVRVPYGFYGETHFFVGTPLQINQTQRGCLVILAPSRDSPSMAQWPVIPIWIPNQGQAGVLL